MKKIMYNTMVTVMLIVTIFGGATIARLFYSFFLFVPSLYRTTVHCVKNMCLPFGAFAFVKSCKAMNTVKCGAVLSPPRLANDSI